MFCTCECRRHRIFGRGEPHVRNLELEVPLELWENPPVTLVLDIGLGLAFANFLIAARADRGAPALLYTRFDRWAAEFSYSLYAVHIPVLTMLGALAIHTGIDRWRTTPAGMRWLGAAGYVVMSCAIAYGFSLLTERHTPRMRRLVDRILER